MRRDLGIHVDDITIDRLLHAAYDGVDVLEHRRRTRNIRARDSLVESGLRVSVNNESRRMAGSLGAQFLPDESGQLLVIVSLTDEGFPGQGVPYYGLPDVLAKAVLDGALVVSELEELGAGVLMFDRGEIHPTLSSPALFQWLAGAVIRLLVAGDDLNDLQVAELLRVEHPMIEVTSVDTQGEMANPDADKMRRRDVEAALDWMRKEEAQASIDVVNLVDEIRAMEDKDYTPEDFEERLEALDLTLNSMTREDVEVAARWVAHEESKAAEDVAQLVSELKAMLPEDSDVGDNGSMSDESNKGERDPHAEGFEIETVDDVLERLGLSDVFDGDVVRQVAEAVREEQAATDESSSEEHQPESEQSDPVGTEGEGELELDMRRVNQIDDLIHLVSAFGPAEVIALPVVEEPVIDPDPPGSEYMVMVEPRSSLEEFVDSWDDLPSDYASDEDAPARLSEDDTGQFRRREILDQMRKGSSPDLDVQPLSSAEMAALGVKIRQPVVEMDDSEAATDPAPPTIAPTSTDDDQKVDWEPNTPSLAEKKPQLVMGDEMTEPPITPKMAEDLQRLQEKVEREETAVYANRDLEEITVEHSDPFGYPPPSKAKRTPFGDLVFYQCAACAEHGAMKVAIHTYRCYRCEAVIEYKPMRTE